jgi:hypothetical protein
MGNINFKTVFLSVLNEHTKNNLLANLRIVLPNIPTRSFKSLNKAIEEYFTSEEEIGTLFIEFGNPLDEVTEYLQILRENKKPDRIILIINQEDINEDLLAKYLQIGFSGILTSPFNEDSIKEVFSISSRLNALGSFARLKVATGIKIKNMLEEKGEKFKQKSFLESVKEACKIFETVNPGNSLEKLAEEYSKIPPAERVSKKMSDLYQGPSERVKKLLEQAKNPEQSYDNSHKELTEEYASETPDELDDLSEDEEDLLKVQDNI